MSAVAAPSLLDVGQMRAALREVGRWMFFLNLASVTVTEAGVFILATEPDAHRWREVCGDSIDLGSLGSAPLTVRAVIPVGGA